MDKTQEKIGDLATRTLMDALAGDEEARARLAGALPSRSAERLASPEDYRATFATEPGRRVLQDLTLRLAMLPPWQPGQAPEAAFWVAGASAAFYEIISTATETED